MGYQLIFWQQEVDAPPPSVTYESLMRGPEATGLRPLPLEPILAALVEALPAIDPTPAVDGPQPVALVHESASVEFVWSPIHLMAEMRGRWSHDTANRIIDVLLSFNTPLYDPQTSERFDGSNNPD